MANSLDVPFLLLLALINGFLRCASTNPVVSTPLGRLQGTTINTRKGATISAFLGVRYAEAPVGNLRFQPPVPVKPWKEIYDATKDSPVCPQTFYKNTDEDCLFLNVYTRHLPNKNQVIKKPVMVFFHPGGFADGTSSSQIFGPQYLMDQDIVLVVPNYRLQTLGFFSTGTKEAPGNNAFKDQVQVLRWIQQNIASFSGDPNDVTISGYSAGGFSVTLHMVSPMTKGLFHKGIAMSGAAFGPLPIGSDLIRYAKAQGEMVNCPTEPAEKLVECLRTKPYQELSTNLAGYDEFLNAPLWHWRWVIEKDFGQERFLIEHPIKSVINKRFHDVPLMIGLTKEEFGGQSYNIINNQTVLEEFDKNFKVIWPRIFAYERDTEFSFKVSEGLRKFYFPDNKIDVSKRQNIADLYADSIIGFGTNRGAKLFAENLCSKVYYYRFNYKGKYSFFYIPGTNTSYGASHHDELLYLFYIPPLTPLFTEGPDSKIVDILTSVWGNFVKTGNPDTKSYKLPKFDLKKEEYFDISLNPKTLSKMFEQRYKTWEKLYPLSLYLD